MDLWIKKSIRNDYEEVYLFNGLQWPCATLIPLTVFLGTASDDILTTSDLIMSRLGRLVYARMYIKKLMSNITTHHTVITITNYGDIIDYITELDWYWA